MPGALRAVMKLEMELSILVPASRTFVVRVLDVPRYGVLGDRSSLVAKGGAVLAVCGRTGKPETINHAKPIVRSRQSLYTQLSRISAAAYKFGWLQGSQKLLKGKNFLVAGVRFELTTFGL
jgi:hypothetical protein